MLVSGGCFFFFQAEDGIRDLTVTGVQTCALPILVLAALRCASYFVSSECGAEGTAFKAAATRRRTPKLSGHLDRKSTRLNSSHSQISYAVFCLKKKKKSSILYITTTSPCRHRSIN